MPAEYSSNSSPKNLSMPPDWWDAFAEAAATENKSLSEWFGDLGKEALPKRIANKLSERNPRRRPIKEFDRKTGLSTVPRYIKEALKKRQSL